MTNEGLVAYFSGQGVQGNSAARSWVQTPVSAVYLSLSRKVFSFFPRAVGVLCVIDYRASRYLIPLVQSMSSKSAKHQPAPYLILGINLKTPDIFHYDHPQASTAL